MVGWLISNKGREIAQNAKWCDVKKIRYPIPVFHQWYCFSCQKHMFIHNKTPLRVTVTCLPPVFPQPLQCQRALRVAAVVVYLIFRIVMNVRGQQNNNVQKTNCFTESKTRISTTYLRCHSRHVLCKIIPLISLMPICIFDMFYHKSM